MSAADDGNAGISPDDSPSNTIEPGPESIRVVGEEVATDAGKGSDRPTPRVEPEELEQLLSPETLRKRFIQAENRYYYRHDDNALAFEDHGHRIATIHDDPVVALSMIQLAEAKGWRSITVKGSEEFRREAWLQASLKGMSVRGYTPREVDVHKLRDIEKELGPELNSRARANRPANVQRAARREHLAAQDAPDRANVVDEQRDTLSVPQRQVIETIQSVLRSRGDSERAVAMAATIAAERFQNNRVYVGKVLAHGEARYENDPKNEHSYYLKLATAKGEKVIWGVDLRRALKDAHIQLGEEVAVANQGKKQVTVQVKDRDDAGKVIGTSALATSRNTWDVKNLESLRIDARARLSAAAERSDRAPPIKVYDRHAERAIERPAVRIEPVHSQERSR